MPTITSHRRSGLLRSPAADPVEPESSPSPTAADDDTVCESTPAVGTDDTALESLPTDDLELVEILGQRFGGGLLSIVVGRDGVCRHSPDLPSLKGARLWELTEDASAAETLREAFVTACMLREVTERGVEVTLTVGGETQRFVVRLTPISRGLVFGRLQRTAVKRLARREVELVELIVEGLDNREIARRMGTTESTVRSQLRNIRQRLGVKRPEAMLLALLGG